MIAINDFCKAAEYEGRQRLTVKLPELNQSRNLSDPHRNCGAATCEGNTFFLGRAIHKVHGLWHFRELLCGKLPRCHCGG